MSSELNTYHPKEERLNVLTHGFGFFASIIGLAALVVYASVYGGQGK